MASVYLKRGKWWIRYKDGSGRWRDHSAKVDTKTQAKRLAKELDEKSERQRLGLEPAGIQKVVTFGDVMTTWWDENSARLRSKTIGAFSEKHLRRPLGNKLLGEITAGDLDALFNSLLAELAPKSVNNLRSHVSAMFAFAIRRRLWNGRNPVRDVKKQKVPKRHHQYLRPNEIPLVLGKLAPQWVPLFATAIYTGLRKGELLGLHKADVDIKAGTILVRRSNSFDTTKGDHDNEVPIADSLRPHIEKAFKTSKSTFVFPREDGKQHPPTLALHKILRRAMARAGLVIAYRHKCRRCGFEEKRDDNQSSKCPKCGMQLWVSGIPRAIRFHDLRHTTATLLLKARVPLEVVQRVLRHTDPGITANIYGDVDLDDMKEAVDTLGKPLKPLLRPLPPPASPS